jgi:hypothetical protein
MLKATKFRPTRLVAYLVVACKTEEPRHPAERTLDHPATRRADESLLRPGQPDHLQDDLPAGRLVERLLYGVAVVASRIFGLDGD